MTSCVHDLINRVDAKSHVWVEIGAFTIDEGLWKVLRIDTSREKQCIVVVLALVVGDYFI